MADRSTFATVLTVLGAVYALERLPKIFRPPSGPRLKPGELGGRDLSAKAARTYWWAESEAHHGHCSNAKTALKNAERFREKSEQRARDGDHTVKDVRGSARAARAAVKSCKA